MSRRSTTVEPRPQLLFLCQTLPYPPDIGVNVRTFNILKVLSKTYDITALCFYRRRSIPTAKDLNRSLTGLKAFADVYAFPIPQEHNWIRMIYDHVRSIATRQVYTRYAYRSTDFLRTLKSVIARNRFELVHLDSLDLSAYTPYLPSIPIACTHHNVESSLLRRYSEQVGWLARWYVRIQSKWMKEEERTRCPALSLNVVVSSPDHRELAQIAPQARIVVVPNGADTVEFRPTSGSREGIVFVGGYDWFPNRDAMEYFVHSILPLVRKQRPDTPVTWVGRTPSHVQQKYRSEHGVIVTGYVDDVRPYLQRAACVVVPLRVGGGTRLKILDSWALGKAVVSTSIGCEGLDAQDGANILIRDDPPAFAQAVCDLLEDSTRRQRIEENARGTAEDVYAWSVIGEQLTSAYAALTQRNSVFEQHSG